MRRPIGIAELVRDQEIARRGIGNAQERLGEAHQRQPLGARQIVLAHQRIDGRAGGGFGPQGLDQPGGFTSDGSLLGIGEADLLQKPRRHFAFAGGQ